MASSRFLLSGSSVFLLLLNFWQCFQSVSAFAYLQFPISRNYDRPELSSYCPQCLNGPRICGDPVQNAADVFEGPVLSYRLPPSNTLYAGEEFVVRVKIFSHMMGHFEIFLCDEEDFTQDGKISFECMKPLLRSSREGEMSPVDEKYPIRTYLPPPECLADGIATAHYRIPSTVQCKRCVLRWVYQTANSCNFIGYDEYYPSKISPEMCGGPNRWWNSGLFLCDQDSQPQRFSNCADIEVLTTSTPSGTSTVTRLSTSTPSGTSTATPQLSTTATSHFLRTIEVLTTSTPSGTSTVTPLTTSTPSSTTTVTPHLSITPPPTSYSSSAKEGTPVRPDICASSHQPVLSNLPPDNRTIMPTRYSPPARQLGPVFPYCCGNSHLPGTREVLKGTETISSDDVASAVDRPMSVVAEHDSRLASPKPSGMM